MGPLLFPPPLPFSLQVLINVVTVALASQSLMPAYVAALVVARDAVLLVGAAVIRYRRLRQVGAASTFFNVRRVGAGGEAWRQWEAQGRV